MKAVLPAIARPLIEAGLPAAFDPHWFTNADEAIEMVKDARIGWVDIYPVGPHAVAAHGAQLEWLFTILAGIDGFDLDAMRARGTVITNGVGINSEAVAEYCVLGILAAAKRLDIVIQAQMRREWMSHAPGRLELQDSKALILGYGTIGRMIGDRLKVFGVEVTGVTRSGRDGTLSPDAWRSRIGEFDWVVLAAPATADTQAMIGADELAAMKPGAWIANIARGTMIDQDALIAALAAKRIGGSFLDVTDPEPLPPEHPLWDAPNCIVTMHMSGRSQTSMFRRGAALFLENAHAYVEGRPMKNVVDLDAGY